MKQHNICIALKRFKINHLIKTEKVDPVICLVEDESA